MKNHAPIQGVGIMALAFYLCLSSAQAQETNPSPEASIAQGKALLLSKCAQCHSDAIWRDQRQDNVAWEATLYRMMGRGAIWSGPEIKSMALYLASDFGAQKPRTFNNQ